MTELTPNLVLSAEITTLWRACARGELEAAHTLLKQLTTKHDVLHALFFAELRTHTPVRLDSPAWDALDNLEMLLLQRQTVVRRSPLLNLLCALRCGNVGQVAHWRLFAKLDEPRAVLVFFRAVAFDRGELAEQFLRETRERRLTETILRPLLEPLISVSCDHGLLHALEILLPMLHPHAVLDESLVALASRRGYADCAALLAAAPQYVPRAAIEVA